MDLDDIIIPEGKKALLVIHEENMKEEENPEDYDKCKYLETRHHRRVLESDIEILEQYPVITISREEKESGIYFGNKNQIPDGANALKVVGETKHFKKYVAQYCKFKDNFEGKKKKSFIFPFGLFSLSSIDFKRYFNF